METEAEARHDRIDPWLKSLGWEGQGNKITRERVDLAKERLTRVEPDYALYLADLAGCVGIVEAKKKSPNLDKALEQGLGYAQKLRAVSSPTVVVFATDGIATRAAWHDGSPLQINGEEVRELLSPRVVRQFLEAGTPHLVRGEVPRNSQAMVDLFKRASRVLRREGIINLDALVEFSHLLFIKILTELYDERQRSTEPPVRWATLAAKAGVNLLADYRQAVEAMREYYPGTFSETKIQQAATLGKLVQLVDGWSFVDAPDDIKGEAYEYFLREYNKGKSALGQHFTARHIIRAMVALLDPKYEETIYDPFCGTAGMLIEALQYIRRANPEKGLDNTLSTHTCFGGEISPSAQTAKMNMILAGDGNSGIARIDSLSPEAAQEHHGKRDVVLTNIPFSTNEELGYIRHCLKSVKPSRSGRFAIIVPERFLDSANPQYVALRQELVQQWQIRRVVSLPREVFRGITSAKTSFIYAIRGDGSGNPRVPYFAVENDGLTKATRRMPLSGRNDLDRLLENRFEDSDCVMLHPSEENGFLLRPPQDNIIVSCQYPTVALGEVTHENIRFFEVKDDMAVFEPGFKMEGPLRTLYLKETKAGYNTAGKKRRKIIPGDLVISRLHTQNGMFAIADREYHATETFMALEVDTAKVNPQFLVLSLNAVAAQMNRVDTTGREQYDKKDILKLPIALPPLAVQDAIADDWQEAVESYYAAQNRVLDVQSGLLSQLQEPAA